MSFILDALKKSENDRQRQSGPALFEVRVAPPRAGFPTWAYALLALLAVNLVIVGWLVWRRPAVAATPEVPATSSPPPAAATPAPVPTPTQPAQVAQTPAPQTAPPAAYGPPPAAQYPQQPYAQNYPQPGYPQQQQQGFPPQGYPQQQGYPPPQSYGQPGYQPQAQGYPPQQQGYPPGQNPNGYSAPAQQQQAYAPPAEGGNPDDYAPAAEPAGGSAPLGHVRRGLANGLMTYEEAASKTTIPPLHMDLHVYAPDPSKRFVLVNAKKLGEGQSLPEGVRVDSITTDGAILSYRGVQFMMERD
jgi:general secretion pathway protein B